MEANNTSESCHLALNIDLIREKIVTYSVYPDDGKFNRGTACALRLVGKVWNDSVVKTLWSSNEPLHSLRLIGRDRLDGFMEGFGSAADNNRPFPPFSLETTTCITHNSHVGDEFYNFPYLVHFLTNCGSGLLQLNIQIEMGTASAWSLAGRKDKTFNIPTFFFPSEAKLSLCQLKKIDMKLATYSYVTPEDIATTGSIKFISALFSDAGNSLTDCKILFKGTAKRIIPSYVFQPVIISLPSTVASVSLDGELGKDNLEFLMERSMNLECLNLQPCDQAVSSEVLFAFLDKFRGSLKFLSLNYNDLYKPYVPNMICPLVRFPVMKKLEQLAMYSIFPKLEQGCHQSMETLFPKLVTLKLHDQSDDMLSEWNTSSQCASVTTLVLLRTNRGILPFTGIRYSQSVTMETMERVNLVLPQLRKLTMAVSEADPGGLHCVFREMDKLTELNLNVLSTFHERVWDTLLTGVPVEIIAVSKEDPDFWQANQNFDDVAPSIKQLKNLKTFVMSECSMGTGNVVISDFFFQFALHQMPNLESVSLHLRRHSVSHEMVVEWERQGRKLVLE